MEGQTLILGVTGGAGAGKSRVLKYMEEMYGAYLILCDDVGAGLQRKGEACYSPIADLFGPEYLLDDGELNRKKIAMAVFDDPGLLKKLTDIVHPAVRQRVKEEIEAHAGRKLIVIEAALLLDDHYDEICDEIWYIYAPEEVRRQRMKADRGYSDERIDELFRTQRKEESFRALTDLTIDNSSDIIQNPCRQIDRALEERGFFPESGQGGVREDQDPARGL